MMRRRSRSPQSGRRHHQQARRSRSRSPSRRSPSRPKSDSNMEKKSGSEKDRKFFQQLRRKSSSRHEDRQKSPQPLSDKEDDIDTTEWDHTWGLGKRSKPDYCSSGDEIVEEDLFDLQNMMGFGAFDTTKTKNKIEKIELSGSISEERDKERKRFEERKFERLYGKVGTGRTEKSFHPSSDLRRRRSRSSSPSVHHRFRSQRSRSPWRHRERRQDNRRQYSSYRRSLVEKIPSKTGLS